MEIRHYLTATGRDLFQDWLDRLRDLRARVAVQRRVDRLTHGNLGDHRFCREGVWELRIDVGVGYRAYYALAGQTLTLLLCGGDKRTQDADIARAVACWQDYQRRRHEDTTISEP
jgi:putative addiction module killer protein